MKKLVLLAVVCGLVAGCSDPHGAQEALEDAGYKNVRITGHSWFGCGKDDTYSTGFEADGATGHRVEGVVCSGLLFKGSTIRVTGRVG